MFGIFIIVLWMGGNMVADFFDEKKKKVRCVQVKRNYSREKGRKSA